jgi:hypothetical protein
MREFNAPDAPPYAILSHTWGDEELLFSDVQNGVGQAKKGFEKVSRFCTKAAEQGFEWTWVDTCCIDKSSSAELSESINSMFQWYKTSWACHVFLNDLRPGDTIDEIGRCRWIKRGWTLQELLAPGKVEFYDNAWNYRGHKRMLAMELYKYTGIPQDILIGGHDQIFNCSVARRMSWAARRETTRVEDLAYCLLGIFDVNMPLLYGEGMKAVTRLQEEILRQHNDLTILAWISLPGPEQPASKQGFAGVLAESLAGFQYSGEIDTFETHNQYFETTSVTKRGLLVADSAVRAVRPSSGSKKERQYMVSLGVWKYIACRIEVGLILNKIGPDLFTRCGLGYMWKSPPNYTGLTHSPLVTTNRVDLFEEVFTASVGDFYLMINMRFWVQQAKRYRNHGICLAEDSAVSILRVTPQRLWDTTNNMFLRPKVHPWHIPIPQVLGIMVSYQTGDDASVQLVILCDYETSPPKCGIRRFKDCPWQIRRALEGDTTPQWNEIGDMATRDGIFGECHVDLDENGVIGVSLDFKDRSFLYASRDMASQDVSGSMGDGSFPRYEFSTPLYVIKLWFEELEAWLTRSSEQGSGSSGSRSQQWEAPEWL